MGRISLRKMAVKSAFKALCQNYSTNTKTQMYPRIVQLMWFQIEQLFRKLLRTLMKISKRLHIEHRNWNLEPLRSVEFSQQIFFMSRWVVTNTTLGDNFSVNIKQNFNYITEWISLNLNMFVLILMISYLLNKNV